MTHGTRTELACLQSAERAMHSGSNRMTRRERKALRQHHAPIREAETAHLSAFEREWERQDSITRMYLDRVKADLARPAAFSPEWWAELGYPK